MCKDTYQRAPTHNRPFQTNDRESLDKSGNHIVCFVCDQCDKKIWHIGLHHIDLFWHIRSQLCVVLVRRGIGNLRLRSEKFNLKNELF